MLALKKIPRKWEDIKFQDHVVASLTGAISKKEYPHVILLKGPSGVGKTTIAKVYASYLMCSSPEGPNPCGKCSNCQAIFNSSNMPNLFYVNGREEGGVSFYREFIVGLQNKASIFGNTKIAIIDEAHGLSTEALEVLLTPLENPSNSHLYVILCTTEGLKIPKSLQSRSLTFVVNRPDDNDLAQYLLKIIKDEGWSVPAEFVDGLLQIIDGTEGNVRECLNILWNLYLSNSFTEEAVRKNLILSGNIWTSEIVKKLFNNGFKTVLMDIEKVLENSSTEEFFTKLFNEVFNLYRYKCLGISLKNSYYEKQMATNYGRVPILKIKTLVDSLIEVRKMCGFAIDKNIMFYYLTKELSNGISSQS